MEKGEWSKWRKGEWSEWRKGEWSMWKRGEYNEWRRVEWWSERSSEVLKGTGVNEEREGFKGKNKYQLTCWYFIPVFLSFITYYLMLFLCLLFTITVFT